MRGAIGILAVIAAISRLASVGALAHRSFGLDLDLALTHFGRHVLAPLSRVRQRRGVFFADRMGDPFIVGGLSAAPTMFAPRNGFSFRSTLVTFRRLCGRGTFLFCHFLL